MMVLRVLLALACFLPLVSTQKLCAPQCKFRFCATTGVLIIRKPGTLITIRPPRIAQGAFICMPDNPNFVRVRRVGEADLINDDNTTVPISQWRPVGLEAPFPSNFYRINRIVFQRDVWGLSRLPAIGNQLEILHKKCFALPIRVWSERLSDGSIEKVFSDGAEGNCLSFRTQAIKVYIELAWDSGDIIEIALEEPDGTVINNENVSSGSGRLSDNVNQSCEDMPAGFKNVVYKYPRIAAIPQGTYKITLKHTRNCGNGPTNWSVKVWIDDQKIFDQRGESDSPEGTTIFEGSYNLQTDSEPATLPVEPEVDESTPLPM